MGALGLVCHTSPVTTGELRRAGPAASLRHTASKVPEVTVYFWLTKVLTTGMGEATSDYLVHRLSPVIAVGLGGIALVASLALQFFRRRYATWIYWLAVVCVAVSGTMVADVIHVGLGIPYLVSTSFFSVALAAVFATWYAVERTLSIHSICTRRREAFYWATVMTTFALGTAAGDMTAATMGLGFFASGVMFAVVIAVPAIAHWRLGLNAVVAFWFAYIVTRPLGASFADWMSVPTSRGGLALGWGPVSLAMTVIIVALVAYLTISHKDAAAGRWPSGPARAQVPGPADGRAEPGRAQPGRAQPGRAQPGRAQPGRAQYRQPRSQPGRPQPGRHRAPSGSRSRGREARP